MAAGSATDIPVPGREKPYRATYAVRELEDVVPSHNPFTFAPDPRYNYLNDRDYTKRGAQLRVTQNSGPLFDPSFLITDNPDATNGPPIIDRNGNVMGGNNRRMTLGRVYAQNPKGTAAYRKMLETKAASFGIDPQAVSQMRNPVLVRELSGPDVQPQRAITDLNKSPTADLSQSERATADARSMTGATGQRIASMLDGAAPDASLNDVLNSKYGPYMVNQLIKEGIFTTEERPSLLDEKTGAVTKAAKDRISKMLLGDLFTDSEQFERSEPSLRNKLERIVSSLKKVESDPEWNLTPAVRQAIAAVEYEREYTAAHGFGPDSPMGRAQPELFGSPRPETSPTARGLVEFIREHNPTAIARAFREYVAKRSQGTMFETFSPEEAMKEAFGFTGKPVREPGGIAPETGGPSGPSRASIGTFTDGTPIEVGHLDEIRPVEVPEMVRLAKDLMGRAPFVKKYPRASGMFYGQGPGKIGLSPDLFKRGNEGQLAKTLAHEIGHLTDYLPEGDLKRGNLLGRLLTMHKFLKNTFGGVDVTNPELKTELKAASHYWKPWDESTASASFKSYRNSAPELYADALSILLNSPGTLERVAPKFYRGFFEYLDRKPEVKQEYFDLQRLLAGERVDVIGRRHEDTRAMFVKGADLRKAMEEEHLARRGNLWLRLRQGFDNKFNPELQQVYELERRGVAIPPAKNPKYALQELSLVDNENFLMVNDFNDRVLKPVEGAGMRLDDLNEYALLKRIIGSPEDIAEGFGDRKDLANPLGLNPKSAQEQLDYLKGKVGPERFAELEKAAKEFHEIIFRSVEEAVKVGSYNKELFETKIKPNKDYYVSFGVLDYLQDFVPAGIKAQKGTLSEVEGPVVTTLLKMMSLNRLNGLQKAKNSWLDMAKEHFADTVSRSKSKTDGGLTVFLNQPGKGQFKLLEDGKLASYDVDPYIAKSFENNKVGDLQIGAALNKLLLNRPFKALVITYNPGFGLFFNPKRDFSRTWVNLQALAKRHDIPKPTVARLLVEYAKALPTAIKRERGITDEWMRKMLEEKAFDTPFVDFAIEERADVAGDILKRFGLAKEADTHATMRKVLKPITALFEGIRFAGATYEILPKIAGYKHLYKHGVEATERSYDTRNYIGTPNFRVKGTATDTSNALFIFSNIMKEGMKADYELAMDPKTRGAWWWANVKMNLLPKFLMFAAASGLAGTVLKNFYANVSEYDKTNYIILPLGFNKDGKSAYARLPHDESGRLLSALFWKTLNSYKGPEQLQQLLAFGAGQLPNLAPALTISGNWLAFLSGRQTYDFFRGGPVLPETVAQAGGWPALKRMVKWTVNNAGLASFATFDPRSNTTNELILELTPGLNRVIKVSDYGQLEESRRIAAKVQKGEARERLNQNEVIDKYVRRVRGGVTAKALWPQLAREVLGKRPTSEQAAALRRKFQISVARGENDPKLNGLMEATTNNQKRELLRKYQAELSPAEYRSLRDAAIKFRVISRELAGTLMSHPAARRAVSAR